MVKLSGGKKIKEWCLLSGTEASERDYGDFTVLRNQSSHCRASSWTQKESKQEKKEKKKETISCSEICDKKSVADTQWDWLNLGHGPSRRNHQDQEDMVTFASSPCPALPGGPHFPARISWKSLWCSQPVSLRTGSPPSISANHSRKPTFYFWNGHRKQP